MEGSTFQTTLSLPDHSLKSSHYVAIWPIPLWCFCTVKRWNSPTIVPCWKATTHTHWFHAISHKLRHLHSKSLIFQTRVQAIDMGNDCCANEPFLSSEFFPIFVVFLMWFIQTQTRQMQGPLANESLGIIYLLWKQHCEPKMGNKAVYRNNLSLGNLLSRRRELGSLSSYGTIPPLTMFALQPISPSFRDSKEMFNNTLMKIQK